jgi:NAD(P)H dehydrogenase (quinone)
VNLQSVSHVARDDVRDIDALVLGSPVHQRSMSWPMKKFIDEICEPAWFFDELVGRAGGVFTAGGGHGNAGAGCEMAQLSLLANLAACGCVIVPFPKCTEGFDVAGMHWGPHIRTTSMDMTPLAADRLPTEALRGAYYHGSAIAKVAAALKDTRDAGKLFASGGQFPSAEIRAARRATEAMKGAKGLETRALQAP